MTFNEGASDDFVADGTKALNALIDSLLSSLSGEGAMVESVPCRSPLDPCKKSQIGRTSTGDFARRHHTRSAGLTLFAGPGGQGLCIEAGQSVRAGGVAFKSSRNGGTDSLHPPTRSRQVGIEAFPDALGETPENDAPAVRPYHILG